jgi:hypothetical protein
MAPSQVETLMSLKAIVGTGGVGGQDLVASYTRVRAELVAAIEGEDRAEFERLFPVELTTTGRPWKAQEEEVRSRFAQMESWLQGRVAVALERLRPPAKPVGFK